MLLGDEWHSILKRVCEILGCEVNFEVGLALALDRCQTAGWLQNRVLNWSCGERPEIRNKQKEKQKENKKKLDLSDSPIDSSGCCCGRVATAEVQLFSLSSVRPGCSSVLRGCSSFRPDCSPVWPDCSSLPDSLFSDVRICSISTKKSRSSICMLCEKS